MSVVGLERWYRGHNMRPTYVKDAQNLRSLAQILEKNGLAIIYHDEASFSAYQGTRVVKFVKVRGNSNARV